MFTSAFASLLLCAGLTTASPILGRAPSDYAPVPATCPSTQLVREANGISTAEAQYVNRRGAKAAQALEQWLKGIDSGFEAGNGAWPEADVKSMIEKYSSSSAYFSEGGKPLVSTFEGPSNADDWTSIKSSTGCLFIPDWSSLGAKDATALGVADGLLRQSRR